MERPSVQAFLALLAQSEVQVGLRGLGLECS